MCRQNHGIAVDYFAVGVMAYECMFGRVGFQLGLNYDRDLMWANAGKKSEITFCQSRFKSRETRFLEGGPLKQLTLSIRYSFVSLNII